MRMVSSSASCSVAWGMTFLPQELGRAQEQPRAQLPAHDVAPLVDEHGQVAVGANPLAVHMADDRLRCRAHHQRLIQLLAAADRDDGQLRRKALDVLGLLLQEAHRDEEREVRVDVAGVLEAPVERGLDVFPEGVAVGPDDHAALDRRIVGQLGLLHDIGIPARVIFAARGHAFFCHVASYSYVITVRRCRVAVRSDSTASMLIALPAQQASLRSAPGPQWTIPGPCVPAAPRRPAALRAEQDEAAGPASCAPGAGLHTRVTSDSVPMPPRGATNPSARSIIRPSAR